jgi:hypothetical protein
VFRIRIPDKWTQIQPKVAMEIRSKCGSECGSRSRIPYNKIMYLWIKLRNIGKMSRCSTGVYFGLKTIFIPSPLVKMIFVLFSHNVVVLPLSQPFCLFVFILPFYLPFYLFLSSFFLFLLHFRPFSLPLFHISPPSKNETTGLNPKNASRFINFLLEVLPPQPEDKLRSDSESLLEVPYDTVFRQGYFFGGPSPMVFFFHQTSFLEPTVTNSK